jgi:hypothetical protein
MGDTLWPEDDVPDFCIDDGITYKEPGTTFYNDKDLVIRMNMQLRPLPDSVVAIGEYRTRRA